MLGDHELREADDDTQPQPIDITKAPPEGSVKVDGEDVDALRALYTKANYHTRTASACVTCKKPHCCSWWVPTTDAEALVIAQ